MDIKEIKIKKAAFEEQLESYLLQELKAFYEETGLYIKEVHVFIDASQNLTQNKTTWELEQVNTVLDL